MYSYNNTRKRFAIFHDFDNVPLHIKEDGKLFVMRIIEYIKRNGLADMYYIFVSNPKYNDDVEIFRDMLVKNLGVYESRVEIYHHKNGNSISDDVDHKMLEKLFSFRNPFTTEYIIVSGDHIFLPGAIYAKTKGLSVKVFGPKNGTYGAFQPYI